MIRVFEFEFSYVKALMIDVQSWPFNPTVPIPFIDDLFFTLMLSVSESFRCRELKEEAKCV